MQNTLKFSVILLETFVLFVSLIFIASIRLNLLNKQINFILPIRDRANVKKKNGYIYNI